ncbi:hypothetical protein RHMOL_Rhmol03G0103400 [Rhododendron molle]|uniref:Uncharacterized protein n=1 Tax=Rhododendron molle TaxID=49168 RepID=A0ACC0PEY2_RHOML|nr:hypothetical protein RHMOL_Rhmol03G0103400 [Rhododendron molle]
MVYGQVFSLLLGLGATSVEDGFGTMLRKYDLAADNIIDAYIVDVDGRILVRDNWARIRFGSSASGSFSLSQSNLPVFRQLLPSSIFQGNWKKMILNWNQGSKCHDYEGLSYTPQRPFVIIDLANLRKITINTVDETAWIEAGATFGELNHQIAKKDNTLGFPAGMWSHVNGRILDSKSIGEDIFWAIRGGGANWSELLLKVTVLSNSKNLEEGATKLVYNWQNVAHKLHKDLNLEKIREAEIKGLYLGRIKNLMPLINSCTPELDLKELDCREMRWLESFHPIF